MSISFHTRSLLSRLPATACFAAPTSLFGSRSFSSPISCFQRKFHEGEGIIEKFFTPESLRHLIEGKVHAIVIHSFTEKEVCAKASKLILSERIKEYTNAPGIGRVGIAYFETTNNEVMQKEYFDKCQQQITALRRIFWPHIAPIDYLRLRLDETWPAGANLETKDDKKMFSGLVRSLDNNKEILPHEDVLERDDPTNLGKKPLKVQLAANVYLQVPVNGGELELYREKHSTKTYDLLRGDSYGIEDKSLLFPPYLSIKPAAGDLVMFNANYCHSVAKVEGLTRLSLSTFIGYRDAASPLSLWS